MADTKNLSQLFAPTAPVAPVEDPSLSAKIKDRPLDVGLPAAKPISSIKQLDQLTTETRKGLDAENQEWLSIQTNKLKALNEEAARVYKEKTSRTEKAELAEIIGHALAQIGYGMAGLKSNTYGGPLKFNKIDWERKYDRTLDEYKTKLGLNKDELEYDSAAMKTRGGERSKLAEDRLSMSERALRDAQQRADEERRNAAKTKKGPKLDTADKILEEFREIEKLKSLYDEAGDDKTRTKLMGDIYVKLGEQADTEVGIPELKTMYEESQPPGFWASLFGAKAKDNFNQLIQKQKKAALDKLAASNRAKLSEDGELPGPVLTPPAASGIIDKATIEDETKRKQRIEELRKKAGK